MVLGQNSKANAKFPSSKRKVNQIMRKYIFLFSAALCFVLCACGGEKLDTSAGRNPQHSETSAPTASAAVSSSDITQTKPAENTPDAQPALLPERDAITDVSVYVDRHSFAYGDIYTGTNTVEKEAILDTLYAADLSAFESAQLTGVTGTPVSFRLSTGEVETVVQIIRDLNSGTQYLTVKTSDQAITQKGPADSFDHKKLQQLTTNVLSDTTDAAWSGRVEIPDKGFKADVPRANTAYARNILDGIISEGKPVENGANLSYDVTLSVSGITYGLNSETGYFFREDAAEKLFAQVEGQLLRVIKTRLGILNATAS